MINTKKFFAATILAFFAIILIIPLAVSAQDSPQPEIGDVTEGGETRSGFICPPYKVDSSGQALVGQDGRAVPATIVDCIPRLYNFALAVSGIIFMGVVIAGGYLYITAGGDGEQTTKAKELIAGALSGLMIMATAYILLKFINPRLVELREPGPLDQDVRNKRNQQQDDQQQQEGESVGQVAFGGSLAIISPSEGTQINKQNVTSLPITFSVTDSAIQNVRVLAFTGQSAGSEADMTELGEVSRAGFTGRYGNFPAGQVNWDISNLTTGSTYTIVVKGHDDQWNELANAFTRITITNQQSSTGNYGGLTMTAPQPSAQINKQSTPSVPVTFGLSNSNIKQVVVSYTRVGGNGLDITVGVVDEHQFSTAYGLRGGRVNWNVQNLDFGTQYRIKIEGRDSNGDVVSESYNTVTITDR